MPYYTNDLRRLLSYLYKVCKGKSNLMPYDCVKNFLLSPLGYGMSKEDFEEVLREASERGLITEVEIKERRFIKLLFDISSYEVKEKPELRKYTDIGYEIERIIQRVTNEDINKIRKKISKIAVDLGLYYPVAAYVLAKHYGIDVSEFEHELWNMLSKT
ncbi:MAG: hypothetical protein DRN26_01190 [Thermoplasmata archaeon]|nr:MAG: hypothetical protein DRN26_01190 [Thermoplasmata archaeon]